MWKFKSSFSNLLILWEWLYQNHDDNKTWLVCVYLQVNFNYVVHELNEVI